LFGGNMTNWLYEIIRAMMPVHFAQICAVSYSDMTK
jgi:hypothetical protein